MRRRLPLHMIVLLDLPLLPQPLTSAQAPSPTRSTPATTGTCKVTPNCTNNGTYVTAEDKRCLVRRLARAHRRGRRHNAGMEPTASAGTEAAHVHTKAALSNGCEWMVLIGDGQSFGSLPSGSGIPLCCRDTNSSLRLYPVNHAANQCQSYFRNNYLRTLHSLVSAQTRLITKGKKL